MTCPACGGALLTEDDVTFRCRLGHELSLWELPAVQQMQVRDTLTAALRALRDQAHAYRLLADQVGEGDLVARQHTRRAAEAEDRASQVERLLESLPPVI